MVQWRHLWARTEDVHRLYGQGMDAQTVIDRQTVPGEDCLGGRLNKVFCASYGDARVVWQRRLQPSQLGSDRRCLDGCGLSQRCQFVQDLQGVTADGQVEAIACQRLSELQ